MKVVMILVAGDAVDVIDAQLAFHLNAGVDLVLAAADGSQDETREILESYVRDGHVLLRELGEMPESEWRARMARLAASDHEADWVIDSRLGEFWWPRAESLKDALVAIPPRYTVVQALVRRFRNRPEDGRSFVERMTVRPVIGPTLDGEPHSLAAALLPVYRADPQLSLVPRGVPVESWRVPLRGWYPIEVLDYSNRRSGHVLDDRDAERELADGSLVVDPRLTDAIDQLKEAGGGEGRALGPPVDGAGRLVIPVPDIVDDAAYAVECAALGEVDFGPIEKHIEDLENRIAVLEARFWPRVHRALRRLARRPR
jgi:hypothetical protein